jgi:WD40 repeat protein
LLAAPDGRKPRQFKAAVPSQEIGRLVAISNGAQLVAGQVDNFSIVVFESQSGRRVSSLRHPEVVGVAAFSPDEKTLATACGDRAVCLWNIASGQELARLATRPGPIAKIQFSADGRRLAVVSHADIRKEDVEYTYPDGIRITQIEKSTAVVTIFSGIDRP